MDLSIAQIQAIFHVESLLNGLPIDKSLRITVNFHPDRYYERIHILESISQAGVYKSQFETGSSNGGLTAYVGGDRWNWESRIFGASYDQASPNERPKYGALNYKNYDSGASPRFGSAFFKLKAEVMNRCTFCYPDSVYEPTAFGTALRSNLVELALMDEQEDLLDDYIEAQIHDEMEKYPEYRGIEYITLGREIAVESTLTPFIIGQAAASGKYDLQKLKKVSTIMNEKHFYILRSSQTMTIMTEYVDDELPLPPFAELFGEGLMPNKRKLKKYRENPQADETTGRWTPEEHRLFLEGIMLYGKDWKKMQPLIKSRSLVQIRTHAQKVFKKIGLKKAFLMGGNKKAKTNAVSINRDGDAAPQRMDADEFDGDDTLVGAEELQLLQQMSAQMMQEEDEEQQRRQRQQPSHHPQNQPSNEFIHLTAANIGMTLPSASSVESAQALWEGSSFLKMGRARGMTMERSNTFIGGPSIPEEVELKDEIIIIVDPFSTGAHLAAEVCKQGYRCARVFSVWDSPVATLVQKGLKIDFCATLQFNDRVEHSIALEECLNSIKELPYPVRAILPGAETGVELADQLAFGMKLRTNGLEKSLARRNKYHMGESVRNAGVRAVTQAMCVTEEEVKAFVRSLPGNNSRSVVKPVQSAGSDDVFLCADEAEALTAFNRIIGTMNGIGLSNTCVLVQEYLKGKEYVVDKVSRDGEHKLVGIWEYEKRSVNGSNFVYFGMRLMSPDSEKMQCMVRYADKVLDALDIKHGPSHMEVMLDNWGTPEAPEWVPCLVEVGARCQGGEGTWLPMAKECIGFTPVEVTLDAYLEGTLWKS
eukprot:gene14865-17049_t